MGSRLHGFLYTFFYKNKVKQMTKKRSKEKSISVCLKMLSLFRWFFIGQKSIFRRYCTQNVKDCIQIQAYDINNKSVNHFSQFISLKVKKNLRKSQAQFREKLRKLRLRQNDGFLIKKHVYLMLVKTVLL